MKIPDTIKIGGITYKIEVVSPDHPRLDNERNNGCMSTRTETIYIANDIPKDTQNKTLIHEIIHAININLGEELVESLAVSIYQILKDNSLSNTL